MNCINCNTKVSAYPLTCKLCAKPLCDTCHSLLKGECKDCNDNKLPQVWRRSWLSLYDQCPYAAYKTIVEGLESKGNVWSVVGNILHDIFEDASIGKEPLDYDHLFKRYMGELGAFREREPEMFTHAQGLIKGCIDTTLKERGEKSIKTYLEYESENPNPVSTEDKFFFQLDGCPKVSATIDRVNPIGETTDGSDVSGDGIDLSKFKDVEIVDYKTGKCFYGKKLKEDLQVPVYLLAYKQTTGVLPQRFTFVFVEEGKTRTFEKVDDDKYVCTVIKKEYVISLQEATRRIKTTFARAKAGKWSIPTKINAFYCSNFCDVAKAGQCSGKDNQQWENLRTMTQ